MNNTKILFIKSYKDIIKVPHIIENGSIKFNESKMSLPLEVLDDVEGSKIRVDVRDGDYIYEFANDETEEKELYVIPNEIVAKTGRVFKGMLKSLDMIMRDEDVEVACNPFISGLQHDDSDIVMTEELMRAAAHVTALEILVTDEDDPRMMIESIIHSKFPIKGKEEFEERIKGLSIAPYMLNMLNSAMLNIVDKTHDSEKLFKLKGLVSEDVLIFGESFRAIYANEESTIAELLRNAPHDKLDNLVRGAEVYNTVLFEPVKVAFLTKDNLEIIHKNIMKEAKELGLFDEDK